MSWAEIVIFARQGKRVRREAWPVTWALWFFRGAVAMLDRGGNIAVVRAGEWTQADWQARDWQLVSEIQPDDPVVVIPDPGIPQTEEGVPYFRDGRVVRLLPAKDLQTEELFIP